MRIIRVLCVTIIASLLMTACGSSNAEEKIIEDVSGLDNYISGDNGQYVYVTLNDKVFVPYTTVSNSERGKQIGIVNGDSKNQIYEYKDYSTDEWIINYYDSGEMDGSMLMREENISNFPDGLESEYDWNHFSEDGSKSVESNIEYETDDYPQCVMVNGIIYQNTGYKSSIVGCGMMDGEIKSSVDSSELPNENDQSNFGIGYGYQYGTDDRIIVVIDEKPIIFRNINSSDISIPPEVLHFIGEIKEIHEDDIIISVRAVPTGFSIKNGDFSCPKDYLEEDMKVGDCILIWCEDFDDGTTPGTISNVYSMELTNQDDDKEPEFIFLRQE